MTSGCSGIRSIASESVISVSSYQLFNTHPTRIRFRARQTWFDFDVVSCLLLSYSPGPMSVPSQVGGVSTSTF